MKITIKTSGNELYIVGKKESPPSENRLAQAVSTHQSRRRSKNNERNVAKS